MTTGADRGYGGLATRMIAFAIDAAVIDLVAVIVTAGAALIVSLFHVPKDVQTALKVIGGAVYIVWCAGYFAGFWSATGQTPGNRVMQIRVLTPDGGRVTLRRGIVRCAGLVLAALPLFAGFLGILFDPKRRGLHDRLAGTVVVEASQLSVAATRRAKRRGAYDRPQRTAPIAPE